VAGKINIGFELCAAGNEVEGSEMTAMIHHGPDCVIGMALVCGLIFALLLACGKASQ
jgi:hypothetical protein